MVRNLFPYIVLTILLLWTHGVQSQNHPRLLLPTASVQEIRQQRGQVPLFDQSLAQARLVVEAAMAKGIDVPVPKDMAGGYTHEQHKQNYFMLYQAGLLFQLTQEEQFARYIRDVLMAYAELYPTLDIHPTNRSYATGKIFWQCLNDANWLVYVSQAYDCIYDWLSKAERKKLEKQLFRPFADFLSVDNPQFFDRIHNHSTWGNAAVGMIALVMDDEELLQRALYGLSGEAIPEEAFDNDGGLIRQPGQKESGFLAQIDHAFSPDGYYTEGPYYQRYAIFPFMVFARSLESARPDLKIFEYREGLLIRSVYALLNQTNAAGEFFPINDAQKGMSYLSRELVTAVDISYFQQKDPRLLSVASEQGEVLLDETGFAIAQGIAEGKSQPFLRTSLQLRDGAKGDEGALGILRAEDLCLVMKNTAQGLGHGHYDKLSFSLYDGRNEVIQDYGAARWVNIDQKDGGRYLKENTSWAKQTIAHNTLTVNETSHFEGVFTVANAYHSEPFAFQVDEAGYQVCSAKERNAYPGLEMHRTMVVLEAAPFERPVVLDLMRVSADAEVQYDLPYYFQGHLMSTSFPYEAGPAQVWGTDHGYQHLYVEANGSSEAPTAEVTWFSQGRFYSLHTQVKAEDELLFVRSGASDPQFNLRRDPAFVVRKKAASTLFFSILEPHGYYSPVEEIPVNPFSNIKQSEILLDQADYTVVRFQHKTGRVWTFLMANQSANPEQQHQLSLQGQGYEWQGPFHLISSSNND